MAEYECSVCRVVGSRFVIMASEGLIVRRVVQLPDCAKGADDPAKVHQYILGFAHGPLNTVFVIVIFPGKR